MHLSNLLIIYQCKNSRECCSLILKNVIFSSAAMLLELRGIILREIKQLQRDRYHMCSLTCRSFNERQQNLEQQLLDIRNEGRRVSNCGDKQLWPGLIYYISCHINKISDKRQLKVAGLIQQESLRAQSMVIRKVQ